MTETQARIDASNASFWDELCGTPLAMEIGIKSRSPENLERFDRAYMEQYPYLETYLPGKRSGERLLEVGLGYGTVSQILAERGFDYHGLDLAAGPVEMVRARLAMLGIDDPEQRVRVGSVLELPHAAESFDHVVTIGCLHHTGDLPQAIAEVRRVIKPGGRALVMLYNGRSFRQMKLAAARLPGRLRRTGVNDERVRAAYDSNSRGAAPPVTEFTTVGEAKRLFRDFSAVAVRRENFDDVAFFIHRKRMLGWPAHLAGLDLYITAVK